MEKKMIQTLAVLVDNEAGVLSQVSRLFSRKGYNIESLAVGATDDPHTSRITIDVVADDEHGVLLANQLRKLYPVHSVKVLNQENSIHRELLLIKVRTETSQDRNDVIQIANIFRAQIVDVGVGMITLAVIGKEDKNHAFESLLQEFGILEIARTGDVSLERGMATIKDASKDKAEFDLGKNVL